MAHVASWKYEFVDKLVKLGEKYPVIGLVRINNIPAPQMQKMRRNLRGHAVLVVSKNNLIKIALEKMNKKGISGLSQFIDGQIGMIFTDFDAFKLVKILDRSRTKAPAKGGEIAPEDIVVHEGETPFKPGPMISELQKAGIPAAVQKGKIVVKKDTVVVKKGEVINPQVAQVLTKLEIYPLTVGLELLGAYEDEMIFPREVLEVSVEEIHGKILNAVQNAINLSVNAKYPTSLSIGILVGEAYRNAFNLALNANIINKNTVEFIIEKAYGNMLSLATHLTEGIDEELKSLVSTSKVPEEKVEEKVEEKKEEKKEEENEEKKEEEAISGLGSLFG